MLLFALVQLLNGDVPLLNQAVVGRSLALGGIHTASDVSWLLTGGFVVRDMEISFELLSVNGQGNIDETLDNDKDEKIIVVEEKSMTETGTKEDEILIRAFPRSGITHHICLCQYLGISIRGYVKYEGVYEWKERTFEGHELHAESLSLEHSFTGIPVVFRAPPPPWAT